MGRRGGKRGGGRGRGGQPSGRPPRDDRVDKSQMPRNNARFEEYYDGLGIVPEEEKEEFWGAMRRDLPNSFRFTGSKSHALAVQERLRNFYIPEITSIQYEGSFVDAPQPVQWYPDQLAWYMTTPKHVIRRFKPFASFQKFLVAETDVGNITRQEVVSMIPPLIIDLKPGMTVLDLCAAPGSKSAQLLEMIHSGEEDRSKEVASDDSTDRVRLGNEDYSDDGRATGLLIANDVDYKRAHMLVHQMKRLASPNIIVTNHDATIFPSIKIPSDRSADGKPSPNRYLKFDRILADVPCSGDGTPRKNLEIWRKWTPSNGLGLHTTQTKILIRALQMLKVGGRVVYSTCSMNPVEDEAVLAAAIDRCGGLANVDMLETQHLLPGLKRSPGLRTWNIMDKTGRTWDDWASVAQHREDHGEEGLGRLQQSMFPPLFDIPLERAMRVYPHQQDTGAFFIAVLEKKSEIKVRPEDKASASTTQPSIDLATTDSTEITIQTETNANGDVVIEEPSQLLDQDSTPNGHKRKREEESSGDVNAKRSKVVEASLAAPPLSESRAEEPNQTSSVVADTNGSSIGRKKNRDQPFEEPFKYLDPNIPELEQIRTFYKLSPRFPSSRFMVRNAQSTATKNIYYTNQLAKEILQENEGKGLKFVHAGVKMFVKQDAPAPDVCPWRIQTDGLRLVAMWVGPERVIKLHNKETLRKLLIEMFPRFHGDAWRGLGEIGQQILAVSMGCCILVVEPTESVGGFSERMVLPLWKSIHSLNLMLPKEERKAMLLRLFNDDSAVLNMGQTPQMRKEVKTSKKESKAPGKDQGERAIDNQDATLQNGMSERRNSSSPELQSRAVEDEDDNDEDDGGVNIETS